MEFKGSPYVRILTRLLLCEEISSSTATEWQTIPSQGNNIT